MTEMQQPIRMCGTVTNIEARLAVMPGTGSLRPE